MTAELLKECYQLGHGVDFCTGREMVLDNAADLQELSLAWLCSMWGADRNEVRLGIEYQRGVMRAAERLAEVRP